MCPGGRFGDLRLYVILYAMSKTQTFIDKVQLSKAAADAAIDTLRRTIDSQGAATWVLAGGSTPLAAYQVIATNHTDSLDWSKVTLLLGDERIGPLDSPDNNWHAIDAILTQLPAQRLRPQVDTSAEEAASNYEQTLLALPTAGNGLPRLDLVWLGVGDDGHTLSLFPNHSSLFPSSSLVIPVHDSPKPPSDRISLSLRALQATGEAMVLASGASKQAAVQAALSGSHSPIALATSIIETHDGKVTWFTDFPATTD